MLNYFSNVSIVKLVCSKFSNGWALDFQSKMQLHFCKENGRFEMAHMEFESMRKK